MRRLHTRTHTRAHTHTRARAHILMFKCWQTAVLSFGFHEKIVYFIFAACGKNLRCFIFAACGKKNWGFCFRRLRRKFWGLLFMQHETAGGNQPERALGLSLGFCVVCGLFTAIYDYIYIFIRDTQMNYQLSSSANSPTGVCVLYSCIFCDLGTYIGPQLRGLA